MVTKKEFVFKVQKIQYNTMTTAVTAATFSPQSIAAVSTFLSTMRVVTALWRSARAAYMTFQHPEDYTLGTGVQYFFDSPALRLAAYVTIATHCTMAWIREWNGLQDSFGRFKATLFNEFAAKSNTDFKKRIDDIYTATLLLLEQTGYFLAATLSLIDVLSVNLSGDESIRQSFGHFRALLESHSSDTSAWIKELKANAPILDATLPHLPIRIKKADVIIQKVEAALLPVIAFDISNLLSPIFERAVEAHQGYLLMTEEHHLYTKNGLFKNA